eukprot:scaffold83542_cov29-Attheya_sp.AAC.1
MLSIDPSPSCRSNAGGMNRIASHRIHPRSTTGDIILTAPPRTYSITVHHFVTIDRAASRMIVDCINVVLRCALDLGSFYSVASILYPLYVCGYALERRTHIRATSSLWSRVRLGQDEKWRQPT